MNDFFLYELVSEEAPYPLPINVREYAVSNPKRRMPVAKRSIISFSDIVKLVIGHSVVLQKVYKYGVSYFQFIYYFFLAEVVRYKELVFIAFSVCHLG